VYDVVRNTSFDVYDDSVGLRALIAGDAEAITESCQDEEISRWTSIPSPYVLDYAHAFVDIAERWRAEGSAYHFAVVDLSDGTFAGTIGLDAVLRPPAQVGYWIAPWARRKGFATRALSLASSWAFGELGLVSLELVTKIGNVPSERVAAKVGYEFVSLVADHAPMHGTETVEVRRWVLRRERTLG
jgi:RimJ/RimL family protein N-acetyltransferase